MIMITIKQNKNGNVHFYKNKELLNVCNIPLTVRMMCVLENHFKEKYNETVLFKAEKWED